MREFKEKPKLGKAKEKPTSAFLPRQAAHMMKEKYIKEMDQRPTGAEGDTKQAPDQVEQAGRWAAGELTGRTMEQGQKYAKKQSAAARGEAQAAPDPVSRDKGPSAEGAPGGRSAPEYPQTEYTSNPVKDRQTVEHRAAVRDRSRPHSQSAHSGQPRPHDGAPVKERPAVDMPRSTAGDTAPKTAAGQASPGNPSEAVPLKHRQRQAVRERPIADTSRTTTKQMSATPGRPSEGVPLKTRQQKALKERPQLTLRERGLSAPTAAIPGPASKEKAPRPTKAALSPKVRRGAVKSLAKPAGRPGVPGARALKAGQKQMQRQMLTQAANRAKNLVAALRRAVQAVAKAVAAVTGAVSGIIGGCVLLVALIIIIVIAAVASSPFGLFFAQEPSTPDTVSISQAVESINNAFNARLDQLQAGDYDSIDIQGAAPDWPDVLAVFAVKLAGADADGVDVATLNAERVDKLTDVFWDMTALTFNVETIPHADSDPNDDVDDSWTERILHITVTSKTADDMRTAYAFTSYQNSALDELLADRAALSALTV